MIRTHHPWTSFLILAFLAVEGGAQTLPRPDHVVIVIEENHSYDQILGSGSANCPYIVSLAASGAHMTESYGLTHPSQPNYVHLFSGVSQGVTDSFCPWVFNGTDNLASALMTAGFTFGGYSEDLPSVGSVICTTGGSGYWRKHNPWVNWQEGGVLSPALNMPFSDFPAGPDYSSLPTVSIVVPNQANDMHDGSRTQGDTWLQSNLEAYRQWAMANNSLLIVHFDEDDSGAGNNNHIATVFVGPMVCPGTYSTVITHHNILRTLLDMYGAPPFNGAVAAAPITEIFACSTATSTLSETPTPTDLPGGTPTETPSLSPVGTLTPTPTAPVPNTPTETATSTTLPIQGLGIYPIPVTFSGPVTVQLPTSITSDVTIKVFTVGARKVLGRNLPAVPAGGSFLLDLQDDQGEPLANGLYHLVVTAGQGRWSRTFVIFR